MEHNYLSFFILSHYAFLYIAITITIVDICLAFSYFSALDFYIVSEIKTERKRIFKAFSYTVIAYFLFTISPDTNISEYFYSLDYRAKCSLVILTSLTVIFTVLFSAIVLQIFRKCKEKVTKFEKSVLIKSLSVSLFLMLSVCFVNSVSAREKETQITIQRFVS